MNSLGSAFERLKFDVRMIDIHKKTKVITAAEVENHLKSLVDSSGNSKKMDFER